MRIQRRILKPFILFLGDVTAFSAALFLVLVVRYQPTVFSYYIAIHATPFSILFGIWILSMFVSRLYELRAVKNNAAFYERLAKVFLWNGAVGIALFYLFPYFPIAPRANLLFVLFFSFIGVAGWRWLAQSLMASRGALRVLFVGITPEIASFAEYLRENLQLGFLPTAGIAFTGQEPANPDALPFHFVVAGTHLREIIREDGIEVMVAATNVRENRTLIQMLFEIVPLGIPVFDFPSFFESVTGKIPLSHIGETWFLENLVGIRRPFYEMVKRIVDVVASFVLGALSLVLFPAIALAIRLDSSGPVLYRQKRVGKNGALVEIVKFRSMQATAETNGAQWADENDPRVTRVGTFLRKSRLDELPQFWNILRGDLSLVGPRPERPEFVQTLSEKIPFYAMRHIVQPGLSGWAQINFPYGSSIEDALEKLQYDLAYIKNRSIWLDMTITLKTTAIMLSRGGR